MKRSSFKRSATQPTWKKRTKVKSKITGIPKALGKRLEPKSSILRSEKHLKLVRAQQCLITRSLIGVQAHHFDEGFPDVRGSDLSDFLAVPLHFTMHDPRFPGSVHHTGASEDWWAQQDLPVIAVLNWLSTFLRRHYLTPDAKVDNALRMIERRRAMNAGCHRS